jgi:molybdate transport system substrate-binding protein
MVMKRLAASLGALMVLLVAGCGDTSAGAAGDAPTVRVAAASDLQFALEDIREAMAEADPPVAVVAVYGSSGTFFQQIVNGAPFDVYLSADLSYPAGLVDEGLADEADLFQYAVGRLVLWVPDDSPLDLSRGVEVLTDPQARRIAIANPEHAPYGVAAVEALQTAGIYDDIRPKLVTGENVAQAGEFAMSGNADVAVIALALALHDSMQQRGHYEEIPLESFSRMDQGGVVLPGATDRQAAQQVREFMQGPEGEAILRRYGFFLPDE